MRYKKNFGYPLKLTINGNEINDRDVTNVIITRDFMGARFPIIMVSVIMDIALHAKLVSTLTPNKPFLDIFFDLYKTEVEQAEAPDSYFMGGKFIGIIDKQHSPLTESLKDNFDQHTTEQNQESKFVRITLMRKRDIPSLQGMVNGIIDKGVSMSSLLLYGFQRASNNLKLCMFPPHNGNISNDVIIPPMGFYQYLEYLDNEYGIYKTRYHVFIEDSVAYLMHLKNDTGIKVNGKPHKLIIETVGKEYNDQFSTIYKEGDHDIIRIPEEHGYVELPSFRHTGNTVVSDIIEAKEVKAINPLTHAVSYNNFTNRNKIAKDSDMEVETNSIIINGLPVDVRPYTIVELRNAQFTRQYRVAKHIKVIDYGESNSEDILTLYRTNK